MAKKKVKPKVLWSVDLKLRESEEDTTMPLYTVVQDEDRTFLVMYHGCCSIHRCKSLEECKQFIREKIRRELK